jgi:hypothetical protein
MQYGLLKTEYDWHIRKIEIKLMPPENGSKAHHEHLLKLFKLTQDEIVADETKWEALTYLEADAVKKLNGLKKVLAGYELEKKSILNRAVEEYKQKIQVDFLFKWEKMINAGQFTAEMFKESDELERATTNNCFVFNGLKISRKPCGSCPVRIRCGNVGGV